MIAMHQTFCLCQLFFSTIGTHKQSVYSEVMKIDEGDIGGSAYFFLNQVVFSVMHRLIASLSVVDAGVAPDHAAVGTEVAGAEYLRLADVVYLHGRLDILLFHCMISLTPPALSQGEGDEDARSFYLMITFFPFFT